MNWKILSIVLGIITVILTLSLIFETVLLLKLRQNTIDNMLLEKDCASLCFREWELPYYFESSTRDCYCVDYINNSYFEVF